MIPRIQWVWFLNNFLFPTFFLAPGAGDFEFFDFFPVMETLSFYEIFPVPGDFEILRFSPVLEKYSPVLGDFEIYGFPCTGRLWVFTVFPVLNFRRLWVFTDFPVPEDWVFTVSLYRKTLSLSEKIPAPGFFPVLKTEFERKKSVPGFFPVLETLSLSEKIPGTEALMR